MKRFRNRHFFSASTIKIFIVLILAWLSFIWLFYFTISRYRLVKNWDSTSLVEYTGDYDVFVDYTSSRHGPRKLLVFYFNNGDIGRCTYLSSFDISCVQQDVSFKYIAKSSPFKENVHRVVSVSQTTDHGHISYLDLDASKKAYADDITFFAITLIILFVVNAVYSLIVAIYLKPQLITDISRKFIHRKK